MKIKAYVVVSESKAIVGEPDHAKKNTKQTKTNRDKSNDVIQIKPIWVEMQENIRIQYVLAVLQPALNV